MRCQYIPTKMPHTHTQVPPHNPSPLDHNVTPVSFHTPQAHSKVVTSPLKPPTLQRLRKNAPINQLKRIPLARASLSFEVPKDPSIGLGFIRIELNFDIAPYAVLPVLRPQGDGTGFAGASVDVVGAGETAFHAGAQVEAVEVRGAVCEGAGPFAYDWGGGLVCGWEGREKRGLLVHLSELS